MLHAHPHRFLMPFGRLTPRVLLGLLLCLGASGLCHAESPRYTGFEDVTTSGFRYPFPEPDEQSTTQPVAEPVASNTPTAKASPAPQAAAAQTMPAPRVKRPIPKADKAPVKASAPAVAAPQPEPETTPQILPKPQMLTRPQALPAITARVAIIIDDIGYSLKNGLRTARFPAPLTLAVLPHSPNGLALAELGHEKGKSIMLHAPMSNVLKSPLDTGGLTEDMAEEEFIATLRDNLASIPHVIGVNNHMGSYLTQLEEPMGWVMNELKQRQLFFIDSRTSADSQAWEVAQAHGITSRKRDVFLDHERDSAVIAEQFAKMIDIAKRRGSAVAIGHPYPETLSVLQEHVPLLRSHGIELVSIDALLQRQNTTLSRNP